jgi:ABC-2 type transport system permease protein
VKGLVPVIKREYLQRVRSKWFLLGTFLAPVFFVGIMVVPILMEAKDAEVVRTLGVVDETGVLMDRVASRLREAGFTVEEHPRGSEKALRERVTGGTVGGYLVLDGETLTRGRVRFFGKEGPGAIRGLSIRNAVVHSALEARLSDSGSREDLRALLGGGELEVVPLGAGSPEAGEDEPAFVGGFAGAMLLYMVILLYAVAVMRATLEEKTSRVVEILVSSVKPSTLMLGKILGVGSAGLTQLAVWVLLGVVALTMGLPALVASRPGLVDPEVVGGALPGPGLTALFVGLFLGGYFLYAGLYAAVGAMCSSEEEAQQAQFPVVLLLIAPVMFLVPVIEAPSSAVAVAASQVPFFSPVLLYARAATGAVSVWEIVSALALLLVGVLGTAWLAGRIYRVGILMQGKRPTLPELWRWVREA